VELDAFEVPQHIRNPDILEYGWKAGRHPAVLEDRVRARAEEAVVHECVEPDDERKQLLERRDAGEISGWSVLLQMSNSRMSDSVHQPQMLSQDWLLFREDLIDVSHPVARGLYAILTCEGSGCGWILNFGIPRRSIDTGHGAQLVTLLAFVDLRETECDVEVAETLDMTKERSAMVDSRLVEPDDLVGIQAELHRQQLLGELYVGTI
jgi:hypothetical protein